MSSKRQQTFAKRAREQLVKERRERKQAKRREKRLAALDRNDSVVGDDGAAPDDHSVDL